MPVMVLALAEARIAQMHTGGTILWSSGCSATQGAGDPDCMQRGEKQRLAVFRTLRKKPYPCKHSGQDGSVVWYVATSAVEKPALFSTATCEPLSVRTFGKLSVPSAGPSSSAPSSTCGLACVTKKTSLCKGISTCVLSDLAGVGPEDSLSDKCAPRPCVPGQQHDGQHDFRGYNHLQ